MPRGRILDKEAISQSKKLAEISNDTGRLIYTWLLPHLDREGRFSAEPDVIKGNVFPRIKNMTQKKIEKSIEEMAELGLIILYKIDGDKYLQFKKFKEFQVHLDRESPSKIPAPTKDSGLNPIKSDLVPSIQYNTIQYNNKVKYLDFILLTPEEHQKLIEKLGKQKTIEMIEKLNNYIGSKGKKYKSHYHTILNWLNMDKSKIKSVDYPEIEPEEKIEYKPIPPEIKEHIKKIKLKSLGG